ncbi:hypothetical protein HG531_006873 [Fusarium graminearum]|nr:hypothetical protein HG531_006873 [Fusarium graminearum]
MQHHFLGVFACAVTYNNVLDTKLEHGVDCGSGHTAGSDDKAAGTGYNSVGGRETTSNGGANTNPIGVFAVQGFYRACTVHALEKGGARRDCAVFVQKADRNECVYGANGPGMVTQ